jgi:hypothetical protein
MKPEMRCRVIDFDIMVLEESFEGKWLRLAYIKNGWLQTSRGALVYPEQMDKFLRYWKKNRQWK